MTVSFVLGTALGALAVAYVLWPLIRTPDKK
jgi:hypothetical protein